MEGTSYRHLPLLAAVPCLIHWLVLYCLLLVRFVAAVFGLRKKAYQEDAMMQPFTVLSSLMLCQEDVDVAALRPAGMVIRG